MIRPIPEEYLKECAHGGRLEELQIPDYSPAAVYLPFGYDDGDRPCSTFYLLHGGGHINRRIPRGREQQARGIVV